MQRARLLWLTDVTAVADHYVTLPAVDLPDLLGGRSYRDLRQQDLEQMAGATRAHWGLARRPIDNIVNLLERVGVIVAAEHMDTDRLDALSFWGPDGRPYVLLANDKQSYARRQHDAAHELAHLLLHRGLSNGEVEANLKRIEEQADQFAAAFLLPSDQYPVEVQALDLYEFERLKVRWKSSIKAQIYRLRTLSVLSDTMATSLFKRYSAKGYSKGEPYDDGAWPLQAPSLLADVFRAVVSEGGLSKGELLLEFSISAHDVENLAGLPGGWFTSTGEGRVIQLKPRALSDMRRPIDRGDDLVLPFPKKR